MDAGFSSNSLSLAHMDADALHVYPGDWTAGKCVFCNRSELHAFMKQKSLKSDLNQQKNIPLVDTPAPKIYSKYQSS